MALVCKHCRDDSEGDRNSVISQALRRKDVTRLAQRAYIMEAFISTVPYSAEITVWVR